MSLETLYQRPTLAETPDHEPYSNEINVHGGTKGPFEPGGKFEPGLVSALVKRISKGDLFVVVPGQESDLVSGEPQDQILVCTAEPDP